MSHVLDIQPLHPELNPPEYKTDGSAGMDLYMPEAGHIPANGESKVGLGFAATVPAGFVGLVVPRSGVGSKFSLELKNTCGFIDPDFTGEILATMRTKDGQPLSWQAGERLLQLFIVPAPKMDIRIVNELAQTHRGAGGYGSTGGFGSSSDAATTPQETSRE